jgi:hypothetical protein
VKVISSHTPAMAPPLALPTAFVHTNDHNVMTNADYHTTGATLQHWHDTGNPGRHGRERINSRVARLPVPTAISNHVKHSYP